MDCLQTRPLWSLPVYLWTGENDAKHATSGREYFLKTEKKSCGLKRRIRIRVDSTLMATPSEVKKFDFSTILCPRIQRGYKTSRAGTALA